MVVCAICFFWGGDFRVDVRPEAGPASEATVAALLDVHLPPSTPAKAPKTGWGQFTKSAARPAGARPALVCHCGPWGKKECFL